MNDGAIPHEGTQRCVPAHYPCRGGGTTWVTSHPRPLMRGLMWARRANGETLRQMRGVLNQSWARGSENIEAGGGVGPAPRRVHLQIVCSFRGV